ncbi:MAG: ATP-binding protein [Planctomycetota bacterium]
MLARVCLCHFLLCVAATRPALAKDRLNDAWRWVVYTTDAGLPSDDILDLVETPLGTTWAATQSGVARFDNYRWLAVNAGQGLPEGPATWIEPIGEDEVLVVVNDQLWRGGKQEFRPIPILERGEQVIVVAAVPADDERLLVLGRRLSDALNRLYDVRGSLVTQCDLPGQILTVPYRRLWKTRSGAIYVSTDLGLFQFDRGAWISRQSSTSDWFRQSFVAENRSGEGLCFTTYPAEVLGTWSWKPGGKMVRAETTCIEPLMTGDVNDEGDAISLSRTGEVVIRQNGTWRQLPPTLLKLQVVSFLRYARDGNLWVGTQEGLRLCHLNSNRWTLWREGHATQRDKSNALLKDRDGSLWIGTGSGLEHRADNGSIIEFVDRVEDVPLSGITGLQQDQQGRIWVTSGSEFRGAFRRDSAGWSHRGPAEGLTAPFVHRIFKDRHGRLWFAGLGEPPMKGLDDGPGAFLLKEDDRFEAFDQARGLLAGRVYAVADGPDGAVWFATMLGLSRFRDGQWRHWTQADGLRHSKIFAAIVSNDGRLWFGQQGEGLGYVDPDDIIRYYRDGPANLQRINVTDLKVGPTGCLWVASNRGIFWYEDGKWSEISRRVGLENPSIWTLLPLEDQLLAGTDGSGTAVLRKTFDDRQPPLVVIRPPATEGGYIVAHWRSYSYLGTVPEHLILNRFRLDDGPWSDWNLCRTFSMESVPHGTHQFEVQARGMFGETFEHGTVAQFSVTAPAYLKPRIMLPVLLLTMTAATLMWLLVSRRRRHAVALAASEQRLQAIVDNTPAVVYLKGLDGRYISINRKFEELFHITRERIAGKTDHDLFPKEMADQFQRNDERVRHSQSPLLIEEVAQHDDGPHSYISAKFPLFDASNQLYALCGISTDITPGKRAEAEKLALAEQLRHSQKMEALGTLAAGVAHDFNNLLQAISGYTEMVKTTLPAEHPGLVSIEMVEQASRQARGVVNALLAFTHRGKAQTSSIELGQVVRDTARMLHRILLAPIDLKLDLTEDDVWILADPTQVQQVIMNLCINSRDAMPDGGPLVIRLRLLRTEERPNAIAELSVIDSGTGMTPDVLARLYEPFFTTKPRGKGTGLGMSIIHTIVSDHGGSIDVTSTPGQGTTVSVRFQGCPTPATATTAPPPRPRQGIGERVLVVEDNEHVRALMVSALRSRGFSVFAARDAADAITTMESHKSTMQLLVLDHDLPRKGHMTELLNRIHTPQRIPVIRVTGSPGTLTEHIGKDEHLLRKPFQLHDLVHLASSCLALTDGPEGIVP